MGHKSTHVTETVYRHVIVPAIRGGASVMDDVFGEEDGERRIVWRRSHLVSHLVEQRSGKPVELWRFELQTSCMPCKRSTN